MSTCIRIGGQTDHLRKGIEFIGAAENPTQEDVARLLDGVRGQRGELFASSEPNPPMGVQQMILFADRGRYVLTLSYIDHDGQSMGLSLHNEWPDEDESGVLCYRVFGCDEVFSDFDVVAREFERYALTGEVRLDLFESGGDPGIR